MMPSDTHTTTAAEFLQVYRTAENAMCAQLDGIRIGKGALHYLQEARRLVDTLDDMDPEAFASLALAGGGSIEHDATEAGAEAERLAAIELREAVGERLLEIPLKRE